MLLILIFLIMLLISFAMIAVLSRPSKQEKKVYQRLDALTSRGSVQENKAGTPETLLKQPLGAGSVARVDAFLDRFDFYPRLEKIILQAHRNTTPGRVLLQTGGFCIGGFIAARLLYPQLIVEIGAPVIGLVFPFVALNFNVLNDRRSSTPRCLTLSTYSDELCAPDIPLHPLLRWFQSRARSLLPRNLAKSFAHRILDFPFGTPCCNWQNECHQAICVSW